MIDNIMQQLSAKAEQQAKGEEFDLGEDGLLYCKKCHTPRQCIVPGFGIIPTQKQFCLCKCMTLAVAEENAQLKTDLKRIEIERARQIAKHDPAFREHTFENDCGLHPELMRKAKKYAADFELHLKKSSGLLLCGPKGTGKTYAAEAIANRVIDKGFPVIFTSFGKIAEIVNEAGYEGRAEYYQSLMRYPLLIIDDVGMERETDYMMEIIQRVIDDRDRSLKPMIITTNFMPEEINNPRTPEWERVWSRIKRTCYPIKCDGNDIRSAYGMERNKIMKKYFDGDAATAPRE